MSSLAGLARLATLPGFEEAGVDIAQAVLEEWRPSNGHALDRPFANAG